MIIFCIIQHCITSKIGTALLNNIYSTRYRIACFKVTTKSYNVETRAAEPGRVKTAQNLKRSKGSNAVLLTWSRAVRGVKSFRGLEACNLVTSTVALRHWRRDLRVSASVYLASALGLARYVRAGVHRSSNILLGGVPVLLHVRATHTVRKVKKK
jgi:hypothetical protein